MTEITSLGAPSFNWSAWQQSNITTIAIGSTSRTLSFDYMPDLDLSTTPFRVQVLYADGSGYKMVEAEFTPSMDFMNLNFAIGAGTTGHVYFRVMAEGALPTAVQVTSSDGDGFTPVSPSSVPSWTPSDPDYTPPEPQSLGHGPLPAPLPDAHGLFDAGKHKSSPLVIDLSSGHTGITLTEFNASTTTSYFDLEGTGFAVQTAWTSGDTGFLVRDLNSDGRIDSVSEMFGSPSIDGFAKLAVLDSNHDLKIDSSDSAWSSLQVWEDSNGDGVTQSGELHSLATLGIVSIDLASVAASTDVINGNAISHTSTVKFSDDSTSAIGDAWFAYDGVNSYYNGDYTVDVETTVLPQLRGYGTLPDLVIAMNQDSALEGMVSDFAAGFGTSGFASFNDSDVASILYQWAGVEGAATDSRGAFVDARQLEFLEHIFDQSFVQLSTRSPNPLPDATADINHSWSLLLEQFKDQLILQAGGSSLFSNPVSYDALTGTVSGDTSLSHTGIESLDANAPSPGSANLAYWEEVGHFLDTIAGLTSLSSTENGWLNDAVYASDSSLTWDAVKIAMGNDNPGSTITGTSGDETLTGTGGEDTISGIGGHDLINAGGGNDLVYTGDDSSTVNGGDGNDKIYGGASGDTLSGGAGNDTIYANDGNNVIDGGTGGNYLYGGAGNETYMYSGGHDLILDNNGTDEIVLPSGITSSDLSFSIVVSEDGTSFYDLLIQISGSGTIQIQDQVYPVSSSAQIETIVFADSSTLDLTSLTNVSWSLTEGDDTASVPYSAGDVYVRGLGGNDYITVHDGNNTLDGGTGNDQLNGGTGDDTFIASPGFDVITEQGGSNTIQIPTGFTMDDLTFSRVMGAPDHLLITIQGLGEIKVNDQFTSSTHAVQYLHFMEDDSTVSFADVTVQNIGTSGDNTLTGATIDAGGNYFDGRGGDDTLVGGIDDNTFAFSSGFGTSTISEASNTGTNSINFHGIDPSHIRMWTTSNGYLHIQDTTDTSHSITIAAGVTAYGFHESTAVSYLEQITFDDSGHTAWDLSSGLTLTADNSGDSFYGSASGDTLTGGTGADTLYGNGGNDKIVSGGGADDLYGGSGNDTYAFVSGFGSSIVHENTSEGTDTIHFTGIDPANIRMWTDYTGALHLQDSADTSHDITISAGTTGSGTHESTAGPYVEQVTFDSSYSTTWDLTSGLKLTADNSGDTFYGSASGDTMTGGTGADTLYGNGGNDKIISGGGADDLYGGSGNDTYVFASGFGSSTIHENTSEGSDTVNFTGIDPADIRIWTDYTGALHLQDTADTSHDITISAGNTGSGFHESNVGLYVEQVTFDSSYSTTWDLTGGLTLTGDNSGDSMFGTANGDTITGGSGGDNIYGNGGNDILYGGGGTDYLTGGAGADTFLLKAATALSNTTDISDFNTSDGDKLDLANILDGHYDPLYDAIADFVSVSASSGNTHVYVDQDGTGSTDSPFEVATLSGITGLNLSDLITNGNLIVHHT
jgi:Ca2+-binding RTX toxin-like protein